MKQIKNFDITRLHMQEDFNFQTRVRDLALELLTLETDKAMVEAYRGTVNALDTALKQSDKNSYTALVNEADAKADKRWSAAYAYVKAMADHPNAEVAEAGAKLVAIFQKYGILTTMGFDEEYGRYANLLQDLAVLPQETKEMLQFEPWLDAMDFAVAQFQELRKEKIKEDSTRVVGQVKDARLAADNGFKVMAQRVNALVIVNGEAPYTAFIDQLNVMIADAQAMIASRSTKSAKAKEEEETE